MQKDPSLQERPQVPYVGIRTAMHMRDFGREIPAMTAKVIEWLNAHAARPSGRPFLRYHVIEMPERMDVELGIPVNDAPDPAGKLTRGVLPAGRYGILTYSGVDNGVAANKTLIDWLAARKEEVVSHPSEKGEVFKARFETFLTDASVEPDQGKWEIEVAIKLRD